ncbi:MAG TPA: DinB family protein [Phycisphaerales bacterium]|nr:DinB family protein [Phycisphaerales bacterium]
MPANTHGPCPLAAAALITWKRNGEYGARLVADLTPGQWLAQPVAGRVMNHPAWVFAHLILYAHIAVRLASAEPFDDPAEHRYGQKSEPLSEANAYQTPERMLATWRAVHAEGAAALAAATPALTSAPNPLARWRTLHPTVGDMLITLMVKHESGHLGQLSAWRRGMGMGPVAV